MIEWILLKENRTQEALKYKLKQLSLKSKKLQVTSAHYPSN